MSEFNNILEARETIPQDQEDKDLATFLSEVKWKDEDIEQNLFDPTIPDLPTSYTLEWKGVMFAPLGGIAGLNGHPGNGKTMTFSMLMAAMLNGEYDGIKCLLPPEDVSILYIDTEMEMVNTQRTVRRIYDMVGWPQQTRQERLNVLCLREVNDAAARWRKVLKALWKFKPKVAFLDGLIDVVHDFNDNKECQDIIYQCMAVASHYDMSLWCLLHLNHGSEKAVGHLGSFLERKATDIWISSKDKETQEMTVEHKKQRLKKAPDIRFKVEDDENHYGHPVITSDGDTMLTVAIADVERYAFMIANEVEWPASAREVREAIKKVSGEKSNGKLNEILQKMKNRKWLTEQTKSEWEPGQNKPKLCYTYESDAYTSSSIGDSDDDPFA